MGTWVISTILGQFDGLGSCLRYNFTLTQSSFIHTVILAHLAISSLDFWVKQHPVLSCRLFDIIISGLNHAISYEVFHLNRTNIYNKDCLGPNTYCNMYRNTALLICYITIWFMCQYANPTRLNNSVSQIQKLTYKVSNAVFQIVRCQGHWPLKRKCPWSVALLQR